MIGLNELDYNRVRRFFISRYTFVYWLRQFLRLRARAASRLSASTFTGIHVISISINLFHALGERSERYIHYLKALIIQHICSKCKFFGDMEGEGFLLYALGYSFILLSD